MITPCPPHPLPDHHRLKRDFSDLPDQTAPRSHREFGAAIRLSLLKDPLGPGEYEVEKPNQEQ